MKVALTGISLAGFATGWMGFTNGSHPGGQASAATDREAPVTTSANAAPSPADGTYVSPDDSQPTPSYSAPTYRTSRGS